MKIYKIPSDLKAFIFDIDSTLYTNSAYAFEQVDCQVRQFAKERGITADEARRMVADYRKKFAAEHNGSKVSLGNTLLAFGVPIEQSVQWRRELLEPSDFLGRDEKLIETLKILQSKYKLICVTNNPVLPARKTLEAIGVSEFFPEIVGLDTCFKSKPAVEPFQTAVERLGDGIRAENCLAVGDRYDMDIALPLEMGMGGILISGVEEVYQILKSVL
ncbi:putative hydrolase of the HAD superfamily [Treponema bryantii]|uniref:Putative hydrolase of the HAD superfamily n=1 Tax=Treponema bryantii TaxID=163 RepID=A0A1H9C3D5_9SPIR|nr:HAD family hydrolase [Treponema bryantii]SEP95614.1 putative hydrolase of the HAD superfamily [Treponema bryantii]